MARSAFLKNLVGRGVPDAPRFSVGFGAHPRLEAWGIGVFIPGGAPVGQDKQL